MRTMSEFQAVIMAAGSGSRMYPLTENIPKALLPVGNLPMIWYPVNLLERAGFEEVIVVVQEESANQLGQVLAAICGPRLKLDVVSIPDADAGTADSLRHIKDKIQKDFLVLSCDLITDVALHRLADIHRSHDATVTALFAPIPETGADREAASNPKVKKTATNSYQRDYVGLDSEQDRLLLFAAEADLEESLCIRKSLLQRYPCINIVTNLMDAHLYIFKKWVVDFLSENKSISSVKGELVPYLVKTQFRKKKKSTFNFGSDVASVSVGDPRENKTDVLSFVHEDNITSMCRGLSSWSDSNSSTGNYVRCHAYAMEAGLCLRTNTLPMYMEANRLIPKQLGVLSTKEISLIHPSVVIKPKSQVGKLDCMVDESVSIGEKVSVKKSVIGKHSTIGERVKISNSVIMDHVTIKEGCNIQGSIICTNAYIKENAVLKDCQVGNSHTIQEAADLKGEAIVAGQMMDFD